MYGKYGIFTYVYHKKINQMYGKYGIFTYVYHKNQPNVW